MKLPWALHLIRLERFQSGINFAHFVGLEEDAMICGDLSDQEYWFGADKRV